MTSAVDQQNTYLSSATTPGGGLPCRFCGKELTVTFIDLGMSPLCETYPAPGDLNRMEPFYPLHAYVCECCFLVQLPAYVSAEQIFSEYAYFSSYSDTWVNHARKYCEHMIERFQLSRSSQVVEVASNDGYLLKHMMDRGIPVLGIEPAANVAKVALCNGVPTLIRFFGAELASELASEGKCADLITANNVLAQVPDLNDFVEGFRILLKPKGVVTIEFPHLLRTIERNEFDQIYHEHFSYFSLFSTSHILEAHELKVFDVEELPTHGGSLRVYACHAEDYSKTVGSTLERVTRAEHDAGLTTVARYTSFAERVRKIKWALLEFLLSAKREGKSVAGYGAPGKGTTLLHYCGIGCDLLEYTVDRNPYKQGRFMGGNHIPIYHPDKIRETKPDYVLILPWNLKDEIMEQLFYIREWGGRFVAPIPGFKIFH
ncbi:MAG: class I SAM-dependent methyltransferase [Acidobacteria bacterium]|nr:class I SAM-dependent methyltransferase [Acidobacteriota bacterium]